MSKRKKSPIKLKNTGKSTRITNDNKPKNDQDEKVSFKFEYNNWLKSTQTNDFYNYLRDEKEFIKHIIYIFHELVPGIDVKTFSQHKHIHPIRGEQKKIVDKAIRTIHGNIQADDLWQLGQKGGLRLICNKLNNSYIPLIIDYHHTIYPSEKHNERDIGKYNYCPIDYYKKK